MLVCLDIHVNVVGETENEKSSFLMSSSTVRWELGSCSSASSKLGGTSYQYPAIYIERCCLKPGIYTLICYNIPPAQGWKNAYVKIDGHQYCDNFINYKSFQKIVVTGKLNSSITSYSWNFSICLLKCDKSISFLNRVDNFSIFPTVCDNNHINYTQT